MILLILQYLKYISRVVLNPLDSLLKTVFWILLFYIAYYFGRNIISYETLKLIPAIIGIELLIRVVFYSSSNFDLKPYVLITKRRNVLFLSVLKQFLNGVNGFYLAFMLGFYFQIKHTSFTYVTVIIGLFLIIFHTIISYKIRELKYNKYDFLFVSIYFFIVLLSLKMPIFFLNHIYIFLICFILNTLFLVKNFLVFTKKEFIDLICENYYYRKIYNSDVINNSRNIVFILRNRRVREHIIFNLIFVLLIFFPQLFDNNSYPSQQLFFAIISNGIFTISFGQFYLAWDSSYFSFLHLNNSWDSYFRENIIFNAKSTLLLTFCQALIIIWINPFSIIYLLSASIFNIGILFFILMYFSFMNSRKIDLNKSIIFNFSGSKPSQFLVIFVSIGAFMGIFNIIHHFYGTEMSILIVSIIGIIPIFYIKKVEKLILKKISKSKHLLMLEYDKN